FFSSRRRHTRFSRDWSSDVCSSDLYSERFNRFSPGLIGRLSLLGAILRDPAATPFDPAMEPTYTQASSAFPSYREHVDLLVAGQIGRASCRETTEITGVERSSI